MPFFTNKFSPKKTPIRKSVNSSESSIRLFEDDRIVQLQLGDQKISFKNGQWQPDPGNAVHVAKSNEKLHSEIQQLQEENNMLKLKLEVLLNMFAKAMIKSPLDKI